MFLLFKLFLIVPIILINGKSVKVNSCGYESCHQTDSKKLNIHLVSHSHDDVGWLKTVDQYFYGAKNYIQYAGVEQIITSVVEALQLNPDRKFIQVETAFFWQWWKKQSESTQNIVRKLINNGQLEIVNGAWSMNDEATTNYQSIIDQFTLGLRRISDTLGECGRPKIGWQIDPFGHSRDMATIFASLGYEALFFARLDWRDSFVRHNSTNLEFVWQGSPNLGPSSHIFAGVLYDFYTSPADFCWDILCSDVPVIDDIESPDYNQPDIVDKFAKYALEGASYYKTNNLLITMGGDFSYQAAEMYFTNIDKLIEGFKKFRQDIHIIYSTPSCYLKSVHEASTVNNDVYKLKTDDFFPYSSDEHSYWTGFYTSRPNSKRFERECNNLLQITKQLTTFNKYREKSDFTENLTLLKEAMGIMQHHDAITGTEKQHVANDYVRIMTKAAEKATKHVGEIVTNNLLKKNLKQSVKDVTVKLDNCLLTNISYCPATSSDRFSLVVYNPLSISRNYFVRLPVDWKNFEIIGPKGTPIKYYISPKIKQFNLDIKIETNIYELVFEAVNIPPLGFQYYYVTRKNNTEKLTYKPEYPEGSKKKTKFGNYNSGFEINHLTGLLSSVTLHGLTINVTQKFLYYHGANGTNMSPFSRASGAYIFRPAQDTPNAVAFSKSVDWMGYELEDYDEVHQEYQNGWIKQVIRMYKNADHLELEWVVGPVHVTNIGVEVITRFTTDLDSGDLFYTDSNGREMVTRRLNHRHSYRYTNEEPVAGNYYPVSSRIMIEDPGRKVQLAVLTDRAQGGSSLRSGAIELMVHRRLLNDDDFGVGEALNEIEFGKGVVVRGKHFLTFGSTDLSAGVNTPSAIQRQIAQRKLLLPWIFIGNASLPSFSLENVKNKLNFEFSGLTSTLPPNIQILTLEPWSSNTVLLRMEHLIEYYKGENLSNRVIINVETLFTSFRVISMQETTLGANQWRKDNTKLQWNSSAYSNISESVKDIYEGARKDDDKYNLNPLDVLLYPMEIRTFIMEVESYKIQ